MRSSELPPNDIEFSGERERVRCHGFRASYFLIFQFWLVNPLIRSLQLSAIFVKVRS